MNYTQESKEELAQFIIKLRELLLAQKGIEIADFNKITEFCGAPEGKKELVGEFKLIIKYAHTSDNGTKTKVSVVIKVTTKEFFINYYHQEDYFGEYYNENIEFVGKEPSDDILSSLVNAFKSIEDILLVNKGWLVLETNRFGIKENRSWMEGGQTIEYLAI